MTEASRYKRNLELCAGDQPIVRQRFMEEAMEAATKCPHIAPKPLEHHHPANAVPTDDRPKSAMGPS